MDGILGLGAGKLADKTGGLRLLEDLERRGQSERSKGQLQEPTLVLQVRPQGPEASSRGFCSNRGTHRATGASRFASGSIFPLNAVLGLAQVCVLAAQMEWQAEQEPARNGEMFSALAAVLSKPESKLRSSR